MKPVFAALSLTLLLTVGALAGSATAPSSGGGALVPRTPGEEIPSTAPVPQKVVDDCLAALRKLVGEETEMKVIGARRGESQFIVDVQVETAEKPWRCFHDGTRCTGTEYQGEG